MTEIRQKLVDHPYVATLILIFLYFPVLFFYEFFIDNIYKIDSEYYDFTFFFFIGILPIIFLIFYWHFIVPFTIYLPENSTIGKDYNNAIRLHKGDNIGISLLLMVVIIVIYLLSQYLGAWALGDYDLQFDRIFSEYDPPYNIGWFFLILILVPGIWEEIAFRGAVLSIFTERKNILLAIALNGLFFGLVHYMNYLTAPYYIDNFETVTIQVIYAGCLGLSLALLAYKMDTIIPCIIIHYVFNCWGTMFFTSFPSNEIYYLYGIFFVGVIPTAIVILILAFVNKEKTVLIYSKK